MSLAERSLSGGVAVALLIVYFVWGSTYLAIRVAIETLPGFTMAGARFLLAGALLYAWGRWRGGAPPRREHLLPTLTLGALLLLGGNGGVVWAEHRIGSGIAALLVAVEPVWVALLAPLVAKTGRTSWKTFLGLGLGLVGVAALVLDPRGSDPSSVDLLGALAIVLAALSWAVGSLWTLRAQLPASRAVATGAQMLAGGALLVVGGGLAGEWPAVEAARFSTASLVAFAYLVVFGSVIAFSAYGYLLRTAAPNIVATYAFVNPIVAVLLGWAVLSEPIGWRVAVATAVILGALALIFGDQRARRPPRPAATEATATT